MKQFFVLLRKELLESRRNFKWIWMPIIFILFGITEPLTAFYMPDILDAVGNLPEGAVIEIPPPSSQEVLLAVISQYSTLGVLVIVLGFMGTVAGERKNGSASLVLVKPVSFFSYILSKWAAAIILVGVSYVIGMVASCYYINILFDGIAVSDFIQALLAYGIWLSFIVTLTIFLSSLTSSPGLAAFSTIGLSIFITFFSSMLSSQLKWSPSQITSYVTEILVNGNWSTDLNLTLIITLGIIILIMTATPLLFKRLFS
ncbi:ABC transporter permease subunit [Rossellomorea vietnamensis]|uniref:ABC transporter permease subunit n=2 Tax=Rossellomorea vietnamensis TaxID=218284 RepID=A0A5D4NXS2_9BACI|nr:ABC transporter permease subunit [Rossellomorea vietnamensis]